MTTPITQHITQVFQQYSLNHIRSVFLGGGLAYAISNGYWHHTPLILLNPVAYTSYQAFMSQELVIDWTKQTVKIIR